MVNVGSLFVLASAVTALPTLSQRDPQTILTSLQTIDTSVQGLQQAVTGWDGGLVSALAIKSQADDVGVSVQRANSIFHVSFDGKDKSKGGGTMALTVFRLKLILPVNKLPASQWPATRTPR